jgi:sugar fermentation stimulation protein A
MSRTQRETARARGDRTACRDGGLYVLRVRLSRRRVRVGALGTFEFAAGWYLYVGTAQRHRAARLARHAARTKRRHWHVDHLLAAGRLAGTWPAPGRRRDECRLAAHLAAALGLSPWPPRFGASDCRCAGHLLAGAHRPDVAAALRTWRAAGASRAAGGGRFCG